MVTHPSTNRARRRMTFIYLFIYLSTEIHTVTNSMEQNCVKLCQTVSVLNAAARLVFSMRRSEHTTPLLRELHWLKVPERIRYRLCVLAFRCLHGLAPSYLSPKWMLMLVADSDPRVRQHSSYRPPFDPLSATEH